MHSQIWFRVGLNDQKFSADSKNICIYVLYDIRCHYMTSHDILWHQMSFDDIRWHLMSEIILIYMFWESAQNFRSSILDKIWEHSKKKNIYISMGTPFGFGQFLSDLSEGFLAKIFIFSPVFSFFLRSTNCIYPPTLLKDHSLLVWQKYLFHTRCLTGWVVLRGWMERMWIGRELFNVIWLEVSLYKYKTV